MINHIMKQFRLRRACVVALVFVLAMASLCHAKPKIAPQKIKAIMVGDRLVDVAYNLGVLPQYMSVRCSMWPMCNELKNAVQVIGCPNCVVEKTPKRIPDLVMKKGIKRIILEKSAKFCIYRPGMKPENVIPLLKNTDAQIEYVDFTQGLVPAIRQVAKLLGVPEKGEKLIAKYETAYKQAETALPENGLNKKVVIINGTYLKSNGKTFLSVEAPGGYTDQYLLAPLGCSNAGAAFKPASGAVSQGHYRIRSLTPLLEAMPDAIITTGDTWAVQQALQKQLAKKPQLAKVPALKNMAVFSLPRYVDASVIEYPSIFTQWRTALDF